MDKELYLMKSRGEIVTEDELKGRVVKPSSRGDPYHDFIDASLVQLKV